MVSDCVYVLNNQRGYYMLEDHHHLVRDKARTESDTDFFIQRKDACESQHLAGLIHLLLLGNAYFSSSGSSTSSETVQKAIVSLNK